MANSILPSKKQRALLEFIDAFIKENNYAPSYREVMRALDYKSVSTVASHINGLIERGWLVKRDNSARSVEVVFTSGQGQSEGSEKSPTPSLLPSHEEWLLALIAEKTNEANLSESTIKSIAETLQFLGLDGSYKAFVENTPSQQIGEATPPEVREDQQ